MMVYNRVSYDIIYHDTHRYTILYSRLCLSTACCPPQLLRNISDDQLSHPQAEAAKPNHTPPTWAKAPEPEISQTSIEKIYRCRIWFLMVFLRPEIDPILTLEYRRPCGFSPRNKSGKQRLNDRSNAC